MRLVTLMAVGDISLETLGGKPPFNLIKPAFAGKDVLFGNLETVLTTRGTPVEKAVVLNTSPDKVLHLKEAGFDVLNVANNHILDMGAEGLRETLKVLNEHGLHFIGVRNGDFDRSWAVIEIGGKRLGFLGYYEGGGDVPKEGIYINKIGPVDVLADIEFLRPKCDFVIVSLHWGIEKVFYPSPKQVALARRLIDAGATVVLGHHPHVIQGIETYRAGLIAYSLGNFQFEFDPEECSNGRNKRTNQSFILTIKLGDGGVQSYDIVSVEITEDWVPHVPAKETQDKIRVFISWVSEPLQRENITESWWFEQIAGEYLGGNLKSFGRRIKRYGVKHLLECIRWLGSPFCLKCYLALERGCKKNMNRDLVKDLVKYAPSQAIPALMGLVAVPVLTRLFLPVDYGNYVLVMATISVLSTVVGWLGMSVIRFYPEYERDGRLDDLFDTIVGWLFITVTALAVLYIVSLFLAKTAIGSQLYHMMFIGTVVFALTSAFEVLLNFLRAKRWAGWYSGFSIWRNTAGLGIGIGLVLSFGFGIEGLLWGSAMSMALVLPLLWKFTIGRFPRIANFSAELTKKMAGYSFPLVVGNLAAWILSLSDRYILEFFRGAHEVGIYSASYAISEKGILLLTSLFLLASGPISIQIWEKEGEQKSRDFVSSLTRYYLLLCLPSAVGLSVLARPIMGVLAGAAYREGFRIMPFVALGGLLLGLQQRFQAGPIFYKKTHVIMITIAFAGLVNIGLNLLLIPRYGYMAAAITTLIGYIVLLAMMVISSRKYFIWDFPFRSLGRAILASAIMAAVVYPVGNSLTSFTLLNLIVAVPLGALLYFSLLFLLGEIQPNEKRALKELFARHLPGRFTPASWKKMP